MFELSNIPSSFDQAKSVTLEANKIHKVVFESADKADVGDAEKRIIRINFKNAEGSYQHTIWEPSEEDLERKEGSYGIQPSNFEHASAVLKQIVSVVNPEFFAKMEAGEDKLSGKDWDGFRDKVIEVLNEGKGVECEIKLLDIGGKPKMPGYPLSMSKEGEPYVKTSIISKSKLMFTDKELQKIEASSASATDFGGFEAPKEGGFL